MHCKKFDSNNVTVFIILFIHEFAIKIIVNVN